MGPRSNDEDVSYWTISTEGRLFTTSAPTGQLPSSRVIATQCANKRKHITDFTGRHTSDTDAIETGILRSGHCVLGESKNEHTWDCQTNGNQVNSLTNNTAQDMGAKNYSRGWNGMEFLWNIFTHNRSWDRYTEEENSNDNVLVAESVAKCNNAEVYRVDRHLFSDNRLKARLRPIGTCCRGDFSWNDGDGDNCFTRPCMYENDESFQVSNRTDDSYWRIMSAPGFAEEYKNLTELVDKAELDCNSINLHRDGWTSPTHRGLSVFHDAHCENDP